MHVIHLLLCKMPRAAFGGGPATGPGAPGVLRGWLAPVAAGPGLACQWQPGRAGTAIEELTANPDGDRSNTLGASAGPASDPIRSPAIVPAGIATSFVLLFGARKLPDAARSLGRSMRILKAETKSLRDDDTGDDVREPAPGQHEQPRS